MIPNTPASVHQFFFPILHLVLLPSTPQRLERQEQLN